MLEDEAEFDRKWGNVIDSIERDPELREMVRWQQEDFVDRQERDEDGMWPDVSVRFVHRSFQITWAPSFFGHNFCL
jgi:hypothetical protein